MKRKQHMKTDIESRPLAAHIPLIDVLGPTPPAPALGCLMSVSQAIRARVMKKMEDLMGYVSQSYLSNAQGRG